MPIRGRKHSPADRVVAQAARHRSGALVPIDAQAPQALQDRLPVHSTLLARAEGRSGVLYEGGRGCCRLGI